jgi:CheY-like chemotaxis protein
MPTKQPKSVAKRPRKQTRRSSPRLSARKAREDATALAAFAHEIRTSLTGILALGELLATAGLGEREARWAVGVKSTAEHLASLINLVIDSAKADAAGLVLQREPFHLRRLVDSVSASLSARAETKGVQTEAVISGHLPDTVIGDAVRLRAALESLIENAVKFTARGSIKLELRSKMAGRGRLQLTFTVIDSGIGLTPAEIRWLFRPFAQASEAVARRYGGAGLGLVFVKRIAKAMGGDLTVTSKAGRGSKFCLTTVVEKVRASPKLSADSGGALSGGKPARSLNILCAEDNPYGRIVINTLINELGHRSDFVGDSDAAVAAVARGTYDLVLMDVMLPGVDGLEATRRIRALPPPRGRIPVIGISARAGPNHEALARAAGMNGYVTKPVSPIILAAAIAGATTG